MLKQSKQLLQTLFWACAFGLLAGCASPHAHVGLGIPVGPMSIGVGVGTGGVSAGAAVGAKWLAPWQ